MVGHYAGLDCAELLWPNLFRWCTIMSWDVIWTIFLSCLQIQHKFKVTTTVQILHTHTHTSPLPPSPTHVHAHRHTRVRAYAHSASLDSGVTKKSGTELTANVLQKDPKTHKRLKECFLIGRNRTKRANFRGSMPQVKRDEEKAVVVGYQKKSERELTTSVLAKDPKHTRD